MITDLCKTISTTEKTIKTMQGHTRTHSGKWTYMVRTDARLLAKAKQHEGIGKKEQHDKRAALDVYTKVLMYCCGLFDLCAHDGVHPAFAEDVNVVFIENLLATEDW